MPRFNSTFNTGNDNALIAGVAGKRIHVLELHVGQSGTAGSFTMKDGTAAGGGVTVFGPQNCGTAGRNFYYSKPGYLELDAGKSLVVDVATSTTMTFTGQYEFYQ